MKLVIAYVDQKKLDGVASALQDVREITGISASVVRGFGRGRAKGARGSIPVGNARYMQRMRVEVFCLDSHVEIVAETIRRRLRQVTAAMERYMSCLSMMQFVFARANLVRSRFKTKAS